PGIRLRGNLWLGEGVEVDDLGQIEGPSLVGNYSRIAPDASVGAYSVLGASVTLLERARTERAVIDASTHVGRSARIERAVGRHLLKTEGYDAGFHVGVSLTDPEMLQIRFCEQPGIALTPALQKEVEKHFTRHELRRAAYNAVGEVSYPARVRESYAQDLLAGLDVHAIRTRGFRL